MKKQIQILASCLCVLLLLCSTVNAVTANAVDPPTAGPINSNGKVMEDEVGNISLADFNAVATRLVFDFEDVSNTYPNPGDQVANIILTLGVSGLPLTLTIDTMHPYGRILDSADPNFASSGSWYLANNTRDDEMATISFAAPVHGFGFVVGRTVAETTVTLYDEADVQVAHYTIPQNSNGTKLTWFGYYDEAAAEVKKVVFGLAGVEGSQWYLDDLSVIPAPAWGVGQINSNQRPIADEAGNFTIAQFNQNTTTKVFDFDTPGIDYVVVGSQQPQLFMTKATDGVDLTITLDPVVPYGRILNDDGDKAGSDIYALAYNTGSSNQAVFHFSQGIYGLGMMLSRLYGDVQATFYDGSDAVVASYTVGSNTSGGTPTGFSWLGYYEPESPAIRKLVLDTTLQSGSQWWLDDMAVIAVLQPAACEDTALPGDINRDCYVDLIDFGMMAAQWMDCNVNYPGCL